MAKVLGIGGIFFKSGDKPGLGQWYEKWLGLPLADYGGGHFEPGAYPPGSFVVWSPFPQDTEYFDPSGAPFMINFVVDDLEGVLARAEEGGGQIVGEIESYDYGRFGWFLDPEGTKIELWEPKVVAEDQEE